jgi:hypothetical protein
MKTQIETRNANLRDLCEMTKNLKHLMMRRNSKYEPFDLN